MANTANIGSITTDFNVTPYYDDYDPFKNYHRILFRPGFAVQARELTQLQTILQDQINKFGKHIFKDGSLVTGGQFNIENGVPFVKVTNLDSLGNNYNIEDLLGLTVTGLTNNLTAYVTAVADGDENNTNTKTLFLRYQTSGGTEGTINTFVATETLRSSIGDIYVLGTNKNPIGSGSLFTISPGVMFVKNHFISFDKQTAVLSRYSNVSTCQVGFRILETIVRYTEDQSLLDPALESSNYSAPGADRFKLSPIIVKLDPGETTPADYVPLIEVRDGVVIKSYQRSQYNVLADEMAKRTYDESGDYVVRGLTVNLREHLNNNENAGVYTVAEGGDVTKLIAEVGPGLAYVKGYEVGTVGSNYVVIDKGLSYDNVNAETASSRLTNYLKIKEVTGAWIQDTGAPIDLYNQPQKRLTNQAWSGAVSPLGSKVGSAKIKSFEYDSGINGTANGVSKVFLFDIEMIGSNTIASNVKSVYYNSTEAPIVGDVVIDSATNTAILYDSTTTLLLYPVGSDYVRDIRSPDGSCDTTLFFKRSESVAISATVGTFTTALSADPSEEIAYSAGVLGDAEKQEIQLTFTEDANMNLLFTASNTSGANSYKLTSTSSVDGFKVLNVGDKISFAGNNMAWYITSINNDGVYGSSVNVHAILPAVSSAFVKKEYKKGDILDLSSIGANTGTERVVTSTGTQLSFALNEKYGTSGSKSAVVTYRMKRTSAAEIKKTLRPHRYVSINCATHVNGTSGPYSLGFSDVYRIRSIRKSNTPFVANTNGTDVTSSFSFNNGQRDDLYDHGTITPRGITLSTGDKLLVELDYFYADYSGGAGYFSVDSYKNIINDVNPTDSQIKTVEIPVYTSPTSKYKYDLRAYLDFRPVKEYTASDSTTVGAASINPGTTNVFRSRTGGLRMPADTTEIMYDYSYYLARKDVVVVDRFGNFTSVTGVPARAPITPSVPDTFMSLYNLTITPYPSLSPYYAKVLNRPFAGCSSRKISNARFTMRDIGVLKNRIENLEYYASLNTLEKNALDMQILDTNGINRFKNGIFVDTFAEHTYGATERTDYRICVDPNEKSIRPLYNIENHNYEFINESNNNIQVSGDLITLPYTEVAFVTQNAATTSRNIENSVYKYPGNLKLDPEEDMWVDTQQDTSGTKIVVMGTELEGGELVKHWDAWQTNITGYNVYTDRNGQIIGKYGPEGRDLAFAQSKATSTWPWSIWQYPITRTWWPQQTTVEEMSESNRTGFQIFNEVRQTELQSLGERVVDVQVLTHIRPQQIKLHATGLKANTKFYVFFDGVPMTKFCTQTGPDYQAGTVAFPEITVIGPNGDPVTTVNANSDPNFDSFTNRSTNIKSNKFGEFFAILQIPRSGGIKQFTTGTKEVVVTDSETNSPDTSSRASAYFTASGIRQTKQETQISTRYIVPVSKEITDHKETSNFYTTPARWCCAAYSFLAKGAEGEEGIFLTSVDLFLKSLHQYDIDKPENGGLGFWVEIREMSGDGGITRTQLPFSKVTVPYFAAKDYVSDDASKAMNIPFPSPVFLKNNTEYALVIHTEGMNPDTRFWCASLKDGENRDLRSNYVYNARPLTGTYFETNNDLNWDIITGVDLTCKFYRAKFKTNVVGQCLIGNRGFDRLNAQAIDKPMQAIGEPLSVQRVKFDTVIGGDIVVSDKIQIEVPVTVNSVTTNYLVNTTIISSSTDTLLPDRTYWVKPWPYSVWRGWWWPYYYGWYYPYPYPLLSYPYPYYWYPYWYGWYGWWPWYYYGYPYYYGWAAWYAYGWPYYYPYYYGRPYPSSPVGFTTKTVTIKVLDANGNVKSTATSSNIEYARGSLQNFGYYPNYYWPYTPAYYYYWWYGYYGNWWWPWWSPTIHTGSTETETIKTYDQETIEISNTFIVGVNTYQDVVVGQYKIESLTSEGVFRAGDTVFAEQSDAMGVISEIKDFAYSVINFQPQDIVFGKTALSYDMATLPNTANPVLSAYKRINPKENLYFDTERLIQSRANEWATRNGDYSNKVRITMSSSSEYLSPVIDMKKTSAIYVYNDVNSNTYNELQPVGGYLRNKYISKVITLAEGQDAEDMNVYLTAYRPPGTDVKVYIKLRHNEDTDIIDNMNWLELDIIGGEVTSSIADVNNFIEYQFKFPDSVLTGTIGDQDGVVQYTNSTGTKFTGFKQFQIKIGLLSDDSAVVPRVADLRCVALQK